MDWKLGDFPTHFSKAKIWFIIQWKQALKGTKVADLFPEKNMFRQTIRYPRRDKAPRDLNIG